MSEYFIKTIEIKNFKCFEDFKAEGFGRVNLIGGKNNVGKTAFMEAVYVNVHSTNIESMTYVLYWIKIIRNYIELVENEALDVYDALEEINSYSSNTNINNVFYQFYHQDGKKSYVFKTHKEEKISINKKEFSGDFEMLDNIQFIDNYGFTNEELEKVYEFIQFQDKEKELDNYIHSFDKNILKFKIMKDKAYCQTKTKKYQELSEFGDGLKHWVSVICSLYACENSYLFIDEIDNGIHYTQLDKLWEIILTISKQQNVQVFATTHSKECIESYARVAKKLEDKEIKYIKMSRLKDGQIMAGVRDYDMLQYTMSDGHEVRGI
ncbi:MAG: Unknown protein [uncultured Sulfurovum sp.]|uniref:ATPase AAA-type core domain-containing protein n=1 Tax=uncultured Sulfurovum sp. TaxID=269237 RepID=A0A6S6S1M8_9BACT|nr:MAG: Unknown protein [uncultured Sulfurovum sp.]